MVPKVTVLRDVTPNSLVGITKISEAHPGHCFHAVVPLTLTLTKWLVKSHTHYSALLPNSLVPTCPQPHCTYIQTVLLQHGLSALITDEARFSETLAHYVYQPAPK